MSPEQARGRRSTAGATCSPWAASSTSSSPAARPSPGDNITGIIFKIITEEPAPHPRAGPSHSGEMVRVVEKALAKDARRPLPDRAELADDLLALTQPGHVPTLRQTDVPTRRPAPAGRPDDRHALATAHGPGLLDSDRRPSAARGPPGPGADRPRPRPPAGAGRIPRRSRPAALRRRRRGAHARAPPESAAGPGKGRRRGVVVARGGVGPGPPGARACGWRSGRGGPDRRPGPPTDAAVAPEAAGPTTDPPPAGGRRRRASRRPGRRPPPRSVAGRSADPGARSAPPARSTAAAADASADSDSATRGPRGPRLRGVAPAPAGPAAAAPPPAPAGEDVSRRASRGGSRRPGRRARPWPSRTGRGMLRAAASDRRSLQPAPAHPARHAPAEQPAVRALAWILSAQKAHLARTGRYGTLERARGRRRPAARPVAARRATASTRREYRVHGHRRGGGLPRRREAARSPRDGPSTSTTTASSSSPTDRGRQRSAGRASAR